MPSPSAETAYLFRHALLRDAAYELQLPAERSRLHRLALDAIESAPAPIDAWALELARHARLAKAEGEADGLHEREIGYLKVAADFALSTYNPVSQAECWERLAEIVPDTRAEALFNAGSARYRAAQYPLAISLLQEALDLARRLGDVWNQARANGLLGDTCRVIGDIDRAWDHVQASVQQTAALDPALHASALTAQVALLIVRGEHDAALRTINDAERLIQSLPHHEERPFLQLHRASIARRRGQAAEAQQALEHTLAIARESGDRRLEVLVLGNLGNLRLDQNKLAEAEAAYGAAVKTMDASGISAPMTLANFSLVLRLRGDLAGSERMLQRAVEGHRESGNMRSVAVADTSLAQIRAEQGRRTEAEALFLRSIHELQRLRYWRMAGAGCHEYGRFLHAGGDPSGALAQFEKALAHLAQADDRVQEAQVRIDVGRALAQLGEVEQSRAQWTTGLTALQQLDSAEFNALSAEFERQFPGR